MTTFTSIGAFNPIADNEPNTQHGTPAQQKAAQIHEDFTYQLDTIRTDTNLTPAGKQAKIAAAYTPARDELKTLADQEEGQAVKDKATLEKELFGLAGNADASTTISFRDAQDRVSNIRDEPDALDILNRAELSGDTILAKAILTKAFEWEWANLINQYADHNPNLTTKITELWNTTPQTDVHGGRIPTTTFDDMVYILHTPRELNGLNGVSLNALTNSQAAR